MACSLWASHRDVAARVLDCVEVISEREIQQGYRAALSSLSAWNIDPAVRTGQWLFLGFGKPGESGQSMLRLFREANSLTSATYDSLFCSITDLPSKRLTSRDYIIFVDDFSGTGRQVAGMRPTIQELVGANANCFFIVTAATRAAICKITSETSLQLVSSIILEERDNVFHQQCVNFSEDDCKILIRYGRRADNKNPRGFGECGLLFVLCHKTPNNTIPILHAHHAKWKGLFPRYLQPAPVRG